MKVAEILRHQKRKEKSRISARGWAEMAKNQFRHILRWVGIGWDGDWLRWKLRLFLSGETVSQTFSTTRRNHKNGEKMSGQLFLFCMIIEKWGKDVRHSWHHFPTKMIDENREKMSDILDNFSPFCTGEKLSGEMLSGHLIKRE